MPFHECPCAISAPMASYRLTARSVWNNYKILHIVQYVNSNITQYYFWFLMDITQYGEKNGI